MSFWIPVAAAAAGYMLDKKMGGNGLQGAMMGGSLGYGSMGSGGTAAADAGGKGVTAMKSASSANSLNAGAGLMGGTGTAVGTSATTGATTGLIGNTATPEFTSSLMTNSQGISTPLEQTLINANAYQPLNGGTAPNMGFTQDYINVTPEIGMDNLGVPQTPDNVGSILTSDISKQGLNNQAVAGYTDGVANPVIPDFADITKSSPEEIANAQGGYDTPLYEKAFDSVMGFAQKNPIALATLGMTALGGSSGSASPQQVTKSAGSVAQQAYNPQKNRILNIRRA